MTYILFLDDERHFMDVLGVNYRHSIGLPPFTKEQKRILGDADYEDWNIVRSTQEAQTAVVQLGVPKMIFFDHDLGLGRPTGYDFAKWLAEADMDGRIEIPGTMEFYVHSANPVGRKNIQGFLDGYLGSRHT